MNWLVPRSHLTAEQLRAVEMTPYENRVILGGPGSGKTQVLVHRAAFLRDRYRSHPERFRIFVYTNTLTTYIQSGLALLDVPVTSVSTLYAWCRDYHRRLIGPEPLRHVDRNRFGKPGVEPDFEAVQHAVADHVRDLKAPPLYDFVMVDEGQDLNARDYGLLCRIARHVTVCLDRKQQIYERGAAEQEVLRELGLRKKNLSLLETLRCSPYVIAVAAALVEDPGEGRELLAQTRTSVIERETPLVYFARDFDDEIGRLQEVMRTRQRAGDRMAVLLPTRRQVMGLARRLRDAGLVVETQDDCDFSSDTAKVMTYHSAKGLTFDSVLMPRLVPKSFSAQTPEQIERLLFVGVSRAIKWTYFSTDENRRFTPLNKVLALVHEKQVTVQGGRRQGDLGDPAMDMPRMPPHGPPPTGMPGHDLLDIL